MLLVSQFHRVYWYNIVLVVLTRSASSVDVECMFSITGHILNGKQSSLSAQSADKLLLIHNRFFLLHKYGRYDYMNRLKNKTVHFIFGPVISVALHGVSYANQLIQCVHAWLLQKLS